MEIFEKLTFPGTNHPRDSGVVAVEMKLGICFWAVPRWSGSLDHTALGSAQLPSCTAPGSNLKQLLHILRGAVKRFAQTSAPETFGLGF